MWGEILDAGEVLLVLFVFGGIVILAGAFLSAAYWVVGRFVDKLTGWLYERWNR